MRRLVAVLCVLGLAFPLSTASAATPPPLDSTFQAYMGQVANAIARNAVHSSDGLFYPPSAYVALKTGRLGSLSPLSDFSGRLLAFFQLDIAAYHRRLYSGAQTTYVGVRASAASASWIPAGACENNTGYWHLNGARLLFMRNGRTVSVRVNSLISVGNRWWVIHLGPNPRSYNVGTVDDFRIGPGALLGAAGC